MEAEPGERSRVSSKSEASAGQRACTEHHFTNGLVDGTRAEAAFRHYLVWDYLLHRVAAHLTKTDSQLSPSFRYCFRVIIRYSEA